MLNYLFRRLNLFLITAFILTFITFSLTYWAAPEKYQAINYIIHYIKYITGIVHGEWGVSVIDQQPILSKAASAFGSTLILCFIAFFFANIIALPLGVLAGLHRNNIIDYTIMGIVLVGIAIPIFWLAVMSAILPDALSFTAPLRGSARVVPAISGFVLVDSLRAGQLDSFYMNLKDLLTPAAVLSFFLISEITRQTRHAIRDVMKKNYIKAAYAKGFNSKTIVFQHVIKNALPAIIHQIRLQLSTIISFAMVIEIVFKLPGTGTMLINGIQNNDFIVLPAAVLLIAGFILITSIFVDVLLVLISPAKRKLLYVD